MSDYEDDHESTKPYFVEKHKGKFYSDEQIEAIKVEARIDELKGMSVHMNPNFNQTDKIMSRIKALQDNQGASNG